MTNHSIRYYKETLAAMMALIFLPNLMVLCPDIPFWTPVCSVVLALCISVYWIVAAVIQSDKTAIRHYVIKFIGAVILGAAELWVVHRIMHVSLHK